MKKIQIILYSLYSIFLLALLLLQNYFGNSLRSLLVSFDLRIVIYSQFILFGAAVYSEKIFSSRTSRNQRIVTTALGTIVFGAYYFYQFKIPLFAHQANQSVISIAFVVAGYFLIRLIEEVKNR